jgi:4-amino-4-deoxy-L-arabinose transferase-like glycosyltransferase
VTSFLRGEPAVRRFAPAVGLLALVLLVAAGFPLSRQQLPSWAAAAILYGVLFWFLFGWITDDDQPLPTLDTPAPRPRLVLIGLVAPLAVAAWLGTSNNVFRTFGVLGWLSAVALWLLAWTPTRRGPKTSAENRIQPRVIAMLLVILAAATFLWFHRLSATPGEPHSDHAETLLDVTDVLNGQHPIFFIRNTGREPWKFYSIVFLVKVFGMPISYLTMKVATVLIGLAAIPAIFLAGRELGGDRLGLLAALLVSWSKWPIAESRVGNRFAYAVFPTALVLWALFRYLRRGDRGSALWAGAWIGIGLYGYIPFRIVPLLVPLAALLALLDPRWRGRRGRLPGDVALMGVTALLVFLPLFHYMIEFPHFFWERIGERATVHAFSRDSLSIVAGNLWNMALAFNVRGDGGWVNFVTRDPFLDVVTGALFLAGFALATARIFRGSLRWALPLAGVLVLTLPSVLILTFAHENPSVNRSVAAIPVVFLVAAAPLDRLVAWLLPLGHARIAGLATIGVLLVVSFTASYRRYFVDYHRQYSSRVEHTREMAAEIRAWGAKGIPTANAYVVNQAYWLDPRNIAFELGDPGWSSHEIPPGEPVPSLTRRPLLFLFNSRDEARRVQFHQTYPGGEERTVAQNYPDRNFSIYVVR